MNSTFALQAKYMYNSYDVGKLNTDKDNIVAYMWLGDPVTIISKFVDQYISFLYVSII